MDAYARVFGEGWDPVLRVRLERRIGEALFRLGHHVEAYEHIHRSFEYLGYPRSRRALATATVREGFRQFGHRLRPGPHHPPAETAGDATAIERFQSYNTLAWMDYFRGPEPFHIRHRCIPEPRGAPRDDRRRRDGLRVPALRAGPRAASPNG